MNKRKTKIICTLGPATDNQDTLRQLMLSGMDVGRVNMSHQDIESQKRRIDVFKRMRNELNLPVGLLLDTKGPEIRTGKFGTAKVTLMEGQKFVLTTDDVIGTNEISSVSFKDLPNDVTVGNRILIDDGLIELNVDSVDEKNIVCTVINGGDVSSNKGINVPNVQISLPFLSDKDKKDIAFAVEEKFDFIAASFTRSAGDIALLRKELSKQNCNFIKIIAKIENCDGVKNIDDIIRVSDGIMVARGDLGVEIPLEDIPIIQKQLIKKCCKAGKIVVTATQMLDSMIKNPRPTRAEATDVANSVYDGTTAIMLSGETAVGSYPVESVETMAKIAIRTENDINYVKKFDRIDLSKERSVTSAISHATCTTAHDIDATAIVTVSKLGKTCTAISKFRPNCQIIAGTTSETVMRQMNLEWGVIPLLIKPSDSIDDLFKNIISASKDHKLLKDGDVVVITAGVPLGLSGTTNLLKVHIVGDILVSGTSITQSTVCANLCVCKTEEELVDSFKDGDIVVISRLSGDVVPLLKNAGGIICETPGINSHAAIAGLTLNKPTIVGALNATDILKSGTTVTLDAARGTVYWGAKSQQNVIY